MLPRPVTVLLAALVTALATVAPARAQDRALGDAITIGEGDPCLQAAGLVAHVGTWLGRDRIAAELGVIVESGGDEASFAITRHGEQTATRRFERLPAACEDRRAVIALAIALALDAAILESIGIPAPQPAPPPGTAPVPVAPPEAPPPVPRPPPGERPAFSLEAEALLLVEVLPEVALAGGVAVAGLLGGGFRIRVGFLATQRIGTPLGRGSADAALLAGRVDGCFARTVAENLLLGGCVSALVGAVLSEGHGFATVRSAEIPWVGGAGRAELRWMPVDVLALGVGIEGLFSIVRPRLDVGDGFGGVLEARSLPPAGLGVAISASMVIE